MVTYDRATLTLEADPDGDGSLETGVFDMAGNLTVSPGMRTGYLVDGRGSTVNSVVSSLVEQYGEDLGPSKRRGFYVDLGGGAFTIDIEFTGWEGSIDGDGNYLQWGDDASVGKTKASATGQGPLTQMDVFMRYLQTGEFDSRNPATLEYGEYSSGGLYDPLDVVVEGPRTTKRSQSPDTFDGTITCISAADFAEYFDARNRTG